MIYTGRFKDINNEGYFVKITTDDEDTTTKELILGTPPFVVNYEGGESIIYKPIKYSSATITVASENIYSNMYSGKNQGTKIIFTNSQRTLWVGYITPNVYNQTYSGVIENLELECIDALSTLKIIKYTTINENKDIVSFKDIFCHILKKCNAYNNLYIINEVIDKSLSSLYVSENNFFDEDDEPLKCSEVLEEILKYLNMTMFADGLNVYVIDYDAISKDYNNYIAYNINDGTLQGTHKIGGEKTINVDSFMSSDGNLSIDNVYNKATVIAEAYKIEDIIEDIFDEEKMEIYVDKQRYAYTGKKKNDPYNYADPYNNPYEYTESFPMYYQFCKHPNVENYYWHKNTDGEIVQAVQGSQLVDYDSLKAMHGATIYRYWISEVSLGENRDGNNGYIYPPIESSRTFDDCILLHLNGTYKEKDYNQGIYRRVVTITPSQKNGIATDNTYLLIKMQSIWRDIQRFYTGDSYKGEFVIESDGGYQNIKIMPKIPFNIFNANYSHYLKYNTQNDTSEWVATQEDVINVENVTQPTMLPFWVDYTLEKLEDGYKKNNILDSNLELYNNISWDMGFADDVEGVAIKIPRGTNIADLRLCLYQPFMPSYDDYEGDDLQCVILKDIELSIITKQNDDKKKNKEEEENTKYENVIEDNYIEELGEINFKVCTYDGKDLNYSSVYEKIDENFNYVDTIENKALNQKLRQEEMLIFRIVNQYKNPHYKLNFQLKNDFAMYNKIIYPTQEQNKNFVIDTMAIDYENNTSQITLIEKA